VAQSVGPEFKPQYRKKKKKFGVSWVPVAHACNLATQEAEIRRIMVEASLGKLFTRPYLEKPSTKKG
jgi:hypothetical protein